ncbi:MAG: type IV pili methyl-accepting chemotaxis transducer N-terminal domain-containing protein [Pseudomonadota bacterium]
MNTLALSRRSVAKQLIAGAAGLTALPTLAIAQSADDFAVRRKVNVAGRQRMLSQRMSRAIAFAALDIERERHFQMLESAHAEFTRALAALRIGDPGLDLPEENDPVVLGALNSVESIWAVFGSLIRGIIDKRAISEPELIAVAKNNTTLLFTADNVVKSLVSVYGDTGENVGVAISINIAGRQRMLSQKMAKEAALIALGYETDRTVDHLGSTAELFEISLKALLDGLPSITLPPPPDVVRLKLLEVQDIWVGYRDIITSVADAGEATKFDLFAIAAQADPLLVTMNDAVGLYETAGV